MAVSSKKKTIAKKASEKKATRTKRGPDAATEKKQAAVSAAVKPAVSVQMAKLVAEHGYYHLGDDGKPNAAEPVSKPMTAFNAAKAMVIQAGSAGITVGQLIANCEAAYGPCAGKLRQTVRVWTQKDENGKRLAADHSDYRKNPLGEIVNGKLRFAGKAPRHNHTSLSATEIKLAPKPAKAKS